MDDITKLTQSIGLDQQQQQTQPLATSAASSTAYYYNPAQQTSAAAQAYYTSQSTQGQQLSTTAQQPTTVQQQQNAYGNMYMHGTGMGVGVNNQMHHHMNHQNMQYYYQQQQNMQQQQQLSSQVLAAAQMGDPTALQMIRQQQMMQTQISDPHINLQNQFLMSQMSGNMLMSSSGVIGTEESKDLLRNDGQFTNAEDEINIDLGKELATHCGDMQDDDGTITRFNDEEENGVPQTDDLVNNNTASVNQNSHVNPSDQRQKANTAQNNQDQHTQIATTNSTNKLQLQFTNTQQQAVNQVSPIDNYQIQMLLSRLKDLEYDNFRLEKRLNETLSRQWRVETLFNTYVFNPLVREKYEQSKYYCQGDEGSNTVNTRDRKTFYVHFVDYLGSNSFRRIQDAIDIAKDNDKVVVAAGVYNESLVIDKQIILISSGYVEIRSSLQNVITCSANAEGCLIKGFTIRRLDGSKVDPTTCGVNTMASNTANDMTQKSGTNVSERDLRVNEDRGRDRDGDRNGRGGGDREGGTPRFRGRRDDDDDYGSRGGAGSRFSQENKFAVYIKEGRCTIEECDMLSECGTVVFCNPRSHTKLVRNVICGSIGSGVMVTGKGARILAEDNHIYGSTGCGIDVRTNASCTLVKNKIHNCDKSGIYILMTNDARIFRNEIWENHFSGIEVTNAQKVEIINNKIYQNKRAGLYFHTESEVFVENNEIIENKNANVIMKEKSRVKMVHNFIGRSVGSGLVILTGSGCVFEQNIIKGCMNNGIDLCNGDIYASKNVIVENDRSGLYGNGHIKGYFQMNKIISNKMQAWNNGLCKYIFDQDGKAGNEAQQKIKGISKERFVMFRNIDDCELKDIEYIQRQYDKYGKVSDEDYERRNYINKMMVIAKELDQIERSFFVPINAHPLKKVNENYGKPSGKPDEDDGNISAASNNNKHNYMSDNNNNSTWNKRGEASSRNNRECKNNNTASIHDNLSDFDVPRNRNAANRGTNNFSSPKKLTSTSRLGNTNATGATQNERSREDRGTTFRRGAGASGRLNSKSKSKSPINSSTRRKSPSRDRRRVSPSKAGSPSRTFQKESTSLTINRVQNLNQSSISNQNLKRPLTSEQTNQSQDKQIQIENTSTHPLLEQSSVILINSQQDQVNANNLSQSTVNTQNNSQNCIIPQKEVSSTFSVQDINMADNSFSDNNLGSGQNERSSTLKTNSVNKNKNIFIVTNEKNKN